MRCLSAVIPDATLLLLVLLLGTTSSNIPRGLLRLADAVCTPTLTHTNTILTVGYGHTQNVLQQPGHGNTAIGVAQREIFGFDTSLNTATITPNVYAGNAADGTWAGDKANGADARFSNNGGIMKPDGTMVYFAMGNALAHVTLSGNYPVAQFAGDQSVSGSCAEGDGTAARLSGARGPAIADATGDTVLVPVTGCNRLALVHTNSPHAVPWTVGTGSTVATAAGYGTSAPIKDPFSLTLWRDRFYVCDGSSGILVVYPVANWQLVVITTGTSPAATANDIPFDNTYHSAAILIMMTWSNCWLQLFQPGGLVGHIVDPEGGNMFLLAGIASPGAYYASPDLNGNVWVSKHAGNNADLGKHSIAYTGCPAMSPHKCKWGYMTATPTTLLAVPQPTRTVTPPVTTAPATTNAASSSASATSGSAVIAAATTAVVGTSAAATTADSTTAAAVTTIAATSTTAPVGSTTTGSSFFSASTGNGASSVTAAALGLVTMVLAMF